MLTESLGEFALSCLAASLEPKARATRRNCGKDKLRQNLKLRENQTKWRKCHFAQQVEQPQMVLFPDYIFVSSVKHVETAISMGTK